MIPIIQYDLDDNFVKEWESATAAAKELGHSSSSNIVNVLNEKRLNAWGFKWKYKDVERKTKKYNFKLKKESK